MAGTAEQARGIVFNDYLLDPAERSLKLRGEAVKLHGRAFDTLAYFVANPGRTISKGELLDAVWAGVSVGENTIEQAISDIRQALGDSGRPRRYLETIHSRGYRWIAPVAAQVSEVRAQRLSKRLPVFGAVAIVAIAVVAWWLFSLEAQPQVHSVNRLTNTGRPKVGGVVPTGDSVFFTEVEGGQYRILRLRRGSSALVGMNLPFANPEVCAASPDGRLLLVRSVTGRFAGNGPMWIVSLTGGAPVRIGAVEAFDGSWSPDGRHLALGAGRELAVFDISGRKLRSLVTAGGDVWSARWSPDGRRIRFTVTDAKTQINSLWEVPSGGGSPVRLQFSGGDESECCGVWSQDGRTFVFQRGRAGESSLWVQSQGKLFEHPVPAQPLVVGGLPLRNPAFGPGSIHLYARALVPQAELLRFDSAANHYSLLLPGINADWIAFDRQGRQAAYLVQPRGELWSDTVPGGGAHRLTAAPVRASGPRWSPDGREIAVMLRKPGRPWKIHIVTAKQVPVEMTGDDRNEADPDWSPDSRFVLFGRIPDLANEHEVTLQTIERQTRNVVRLPGTEGLWAGRWSPAGGQIAALEVNSLRLVLYDVASAARRILTKGAATRPQWSEDGQYVRYVHPDSARPELRRVRVSDGLDEPVPMPAGMAHPATFGGAWLGFHPDGSALAVRNASEHEVYRIDWTWR